MILVTDLSLKWIFGMMTVIVEKYQKAVQKCHVDKIVFTL